MRHLAVPLLLLTSCGSTSLLGNVEHSEFFTDNRPQRILKATATELGLVQQAAGAAGGTGGERGEWRFGFRFVGDDAERSELLARAKTEVEQEIRKSGMVIHARNSWGGTLDGFEYQYAGGEVYGTLFLYSATTAEGIEVRGSHEEHRQPWLR